VSYAKSFALVIGIDRYQKIHPLNYAVADARDVAATLPSLGFPKENIRLLVDGQATKDAINNALYRDLNERMQVTDRLFVYFAGHGETQDIKGGEEGYLLPVDADPKALGATAISMDEVKRMGQRVNARHVFFAIDACFAGFATRSAVTQSTSDAYLTKVATLQAVQVLTAGRKGEQAIEEGGHGLFTRRLLDALRGQADLEDRGYITASQLFSWIEQRVVRDSEGKMTPQYRQLEGEGQFFFTMPRVAGPAMATITPPKPTGRMEARADLGSLALKATLSGIEVWVGEERFGETTAGTTLVIDNLVAGRHRLRARKAGYRDWEREVSVTSKTLTETAIDLEPLRADGARPGRGEPPMVAALPPGALPAAGAARALGVDRAPMVLVPAGAFLMGAREDDARAANAEKPQRTVMLRAFWIDQYEVTNAQWKAFREARGGGGGGSTALAHDPRFGGPSRPLVGVTWDQAEEYCKWAGKRLPTEAEWEKAARGTDGRLYPWGDASGVTPPAHVGKARTSDVGTYPQGSSPYGALDMAGNVWEWVHDWYDAGLYRRESAPTNPKGPAAGGEKVLRGGSWWERDVSAARVTARHHQPPDRAHNNVGFRCALPGDDSLR
jgi:formylglycine-generating enzyme required for sulfatase activity